MIEIIKMLLARWEKTAEVVGTSSGDLVAVRDGVRLTAAPMGRPPVPARLHIFQDVPSFAMWLLKYAAPDTEILADLGTGFAAYPFNRWGGDLVRCVPQPHPAWLALKGLSGGALRQPAFYQGLLKLRPYLYEAEKVLPAVAGLEVKTTGKIVSNVDSKTGAVKLVSVEKDTSYPVNLPAEIALFLPLHIGGDTVQVRASLLPQVTEGGLMLTLTIKEEELVLLAAWEQQVAALRKLLPEPWLVGLGKLQISQ